MPDITMCQGSVGSLSCIKKDSCYRFTAKPSSHQSFFYLLPLKEMGFDEQYCDYYLEEEKDNAS